MSLPIAKSLHVKCRFPNEYMYKRPEDGKSQRIARKEVPAGYISWDIEFDMYDPISFTAPHILGKPWADPDLASDQNFKPRWNQIDGNINRKSHEGPYKVQNGMPLNIRGRTGLSGRGILGRYGPNHAADPIVTRWKRDERGNPIFHEQNGRKILQCVVIQRRDTGEWAIPGGMVDAGENVSATVRREFMEEALDSTGKGRENVEESRAMVNAFFADGREIYAGYVDDPRNTDIAWMETTAFLFHDETGDKVGQLKLQAGDDAKDLKWIDLSADINLYASHKDFIERAVRQLGAHW